MKSMYLKIPGAQLTDAQKKLVERSINPKFEPPSGGWIRARTFYFSSDRKRFIGVFE